MFLIGSIGLNGIYLPIDLRKKKPTIHGSVYFTIPMVWYGVGMIYYLDQLLGVLIFPCYPDLWI